MALMNYNKIMEEMITELEGHEKCPSLLLQSCCAPCSSHVLSVLSPHFNITILYYNPNIEPYEEYLKRNNETLESWEKEARKIAEERVKASLILQTLALENKVTVSDDLVAAKIAELKDVYQKSPEALKSLKDPNVRMDIKNRMIIEAALDLLVKANS